MIEQPPEEEDREERIIPLSQLKIVHANEKTRQAVDDWHYWVERHYRF